MPPGASGSFSFDAGGVDGSFSFYALATDKAGNVQALAGADSTTVLDRVGTIIGEVHPTDTPGADVRLLDELVARGWQWVRPLRHHTFCLRAPTGR